MKFCFVFFNLALVILSNLNAQRIRPAKIKKLIEKSEVLNQHFSGFMLYDLEKRKPVFEHLSHKYFTPASNTKLFTFYSGLKLLADSLPGLQYIIKADSLIFWSAADPVFLHPDFKEQRVKEFLLDSGKNLYWAKGRYLGDFYGVGWSYDDYNEYYQPEISEMPVYGNTLRIKKIDGLLMFSPPDTNIFNLVTDTLLKTGNFKIKRNIENNTFYRTSELIPDSVTQEVPFKTDQITLELLLKNVFPKFKGIIKEEIPANVQTIYSVAKDSVFKRLLTQSDNFIAEQLLLNYSIAINKTMESKNVIDYVLETYLSNLPDKPQWVDGSGLSRQNLFTPADMVYISEMIYDEVANEERLFNLLPNGGKTGTLRSIFKDKSPFIFAKSGSLSNNYNLTGYLKTKAGKTLIFSFMNNNFLSTTAKVKKEMEKILTLIHEKYR